MAVAVPQNRAIVPISEQQLVHFNQALAARAQLPFSLYIYHLRTVRRSDQVLAVLNGTLQSPSVRANLRNRNLCAVVRRLDAMHQQAIINYGLMLNQAIENDQRVYAYLTSPIPWDGSWAIFNDVISWGYYFWIVCTFQNSEIRRSSSMFRMTWLNEVGVLEHQRLRDMQQIIEESARPLLDELRELDARGETNVEHLRNLRQLERIYSSERLGVLVIDGVNIQQYNQDVRARLRIRVEEN